MCMVKWHHLQKEEGEQDAAQPLHYQWFTTLHLHPALFLTCSRCRFFSPWLLFSTGSGVLRMNVNIHQVRARMDYLLHTHLWGPRVMLTDEPRLPSQCRRDCLFLLFHSQTEWAKSLYSGLIRAQCFGWRSGKFSKHTFVRIFLPWFWKSFLRGKPLSITNFSRAFLAFCVLFVSCEWWKQEIRLIFSMSLSISFMLPVVSHMPRPEFKLKLMSIKTRHDH